MWSWTSFYWVFRHAWEHQLDAEELRRRSARDTAERRLNQLKDLRHHLAELPTTWGQRPHFTIELIICKLSGGKGPGCLWTCRGSSPDQKFTAGVDHAKPPLNEAS